MNLDGWLFAERYFEAAAIGHSPDMPSLSCHYEGQGVWRQIIDGWQDGHDTRTTHRLQKKIKNRREVLKNLLEGVENDFEIGQQAFIFDVLKIEGEFCRHYFLDIELFGVGMIAQQFVFVRIFDAGIIGDAWLDGEHLHLFVAVHILSLIHI